MVQHCDIKGCTNESDNKVWTEVKDQYNNEFWLELFVCDEHFYNVKPPKK